MIVIVHCVVVSNLRGMKCQDSFNIFNSIVGFACKPFVGGSHTPNAFFWDCKDESQ